MDVLFDLQWFAIISELLSVHYSISLEIIYLFIFINSVLTLPVIEWCICALWTKFAKSMFLKKYV